MFDDKGKPIVWWGSDDHMCCGAEDVTSGPGTDYHPYIEKEYFDALQRDIAALEHVLNKIASCSTEDNAECPYFAAEALTQLENGRKNR